MSTRLFIAHNLAAAFLAGPWSLDGLVAQGKSATGRRERWLYGLAQRVLTAFADQPAGPDMESLAQFISGDEGFARAWRALWQQQRLPLRQLFWVAPAMKPAAGAAGSWQIPSLVTTAALAEWLGLGPKELDWFADCQGREGKVPPGSLRHYTYQWLAQPSGKLRLLEMPKARLKAIQRRLLHEILDRIPPHEAVHSYRRGRSIATYIAPHTGQALVLHMDLRDFFPSIRSSRVHALFRHAGYPPAVARTLTGLCTNVVPWDIECAAPRQEGAANGWGQHWLFRSAHLPQGAPTSPALANLCAYRLDCRLAGLAKAVGACYTRYADDLAFSGTGEVERCARRFQVHVCRIALEEGFEAHTRKTRFMRQGVRQQIAGIVVNMRPNVRRREYERLKAILYNCVRFGPQAQNREDRNDFRAYLAGRVAYVRMLNPSRGRRLNGLLERITWGTVQ